VLVGPGEQFPNPLALFLEGAPNIDWASGINNYTAFTLDPETREVRVTYHDGEGGVLAERTFVV
jgi:hypothetical protein